MTIIKKHMTTSNPDQIIHAPKSKPILSGDTHKDLGNVKKGSTEPFEYTLVNNNDRPIIIYDVKVGCNCKKHLNPEVLNEKSVTGISSKVLQKGDSIVLKFSINTAGKPVTINDNVSFRSSWEEDYIKSYKKEITFEEYKRLNDFTNQLRFTLQQV